MSFSPRIAHFSHKIIVLSSVLLVFSAVPVLAEEYYPDDPYFEEQWYLRHIGAPEAWTATRGANVVVAVIDGGVDILHPDLERNIWVNPGEISGDGIDNDENGFVDDVHGWNFVNESGDVMPMASNGQSDITWSHGTISSSLIAARGDNGIGIVGVAWEAKIMPIVVLGADGFGSHYHIGRAIDYAIDQGADVINLSLFGFEDGEPMRRAIQRARKRGVVVVAAVGNDFALREGLNVDVFPTSPACSEFLRDDVLGVAGTDVLDQHAIYTNTGERCSDIAAPADGIVADHPRLPPPSPETEEDGETREVIRGLTGTSLSAPLVSGAAALVKSLKPEWSAQDIYAHLLATSDAIAGSKQLDDPGYLGQGRLNIGKAVGSLASAADPFDFPQKKKPPAFQSIFLSQVIDFFTR